VGAAAALVWKKKKRRRLCLSRGPTSVFWRERETGLF
jgi:hypothetical protein